MEEIIRMQDNLLLIRRAVGWTAEEFGEKIGVTRQTINNIESGRNKLTKTQYIAMRSVLEAEMIQEPEETQMLRVLLEVLIDNPEKYSEEKRNELRTKANIMAPSILAGTATRAEVSKELLVIAGLVLGSSISAILGPIGVGIGALLAPSKASTSLLAGSWLLKAISDTTKKAKK